MGCVESEGHCYIQILQSLNFVSFASSEMAQAAATEMRFNSENGRKKPSFLHHIAPCFGEQLEKLPSVVESSGKAFGTALDHPTYAVVTFTSRQAAIAARQSLADGGAINTWKQVDDIPIAPLGKGQCVCC
jgi:uroporphyrinogen-III synthase